MAARSQTPEDSPLPGGIPRPRLAFIDNLRILLICLVIVTHLAITYGAVGDWYIRDPSADSMSAAVLTLVAALDQCFMMGFFFMISAYFVPGSLERKGSARFARDRLVRLGIPLVLWALVIGPVLDYWVGVTFSGYAGSLAGFYRDGIASFQGFPIGPLWFVFALLVFTFAYIGYRVLREWFARIRGPQANRLGKTWSGINRSTPPSGTIPPMNPLPSLHPSRTLHGPGKMFRAMPPSTCHRVGKRRSPRSWRLPGLPSSSGS